MDHLLDKSGTETCRFFLLLWLKWIGVRKNLDKNSIRAGDYPDFNLNPSWILHRNYPSFNPYLSWTLTEYYPEITPHFNPERNPSTCYNMVKEIFNDCSKQVGLCFIWCFFADKDVFQTAAEEQESRTACLFVLPYWQLNMENATSEVKMLRAFLRLRGLFIVALLRLLNF